MSARRWSIAVLVAANLACLPPGLWPHLGFAYRLILPVLEATIPYSEWGDTVAIVAIVGASIALAAADLIATRRFLSKPPAGARVESTAYAAISAILAAVNLLLAAVWVLLAMRND